MAGVAWGVGFTVGAAVGLAVGAAAVARGSEGSVAVWGEAATDPPPSSPPAQAAPLALQALRGEVISFQVGVAGAVQRGALALGFRGPGATPPAVSFFRRPARGDVLVPLAAIEGSPVALWVEVHVPRDAAPGRFVGTLRAGGGQLEVDLDVSPVVLPRVPILQVTAASEALGEGGAALALARGVAPEGLWQSALPAGRFDGRAFDTAFAPLLDGQGRPGLSTIVLPDLGGLDDVQRFRYWLELDHKLGKRAARVVYFGGDGFEGEEAAAFHRALPEAELLLAKDDEGEADGQLVPIGSSGQVLSLDAPAPARPRGALWWQLPFTAQERFPSLSPEADPRSLRAVGWMALALGVRGVRLLAPERAGDALSAGGQPTVRLELLRAAIQDHALLTLALGRDRAAALAVAREVTPRADGWPQDSAAFAAARAKLLALLTTAPRRPSWAPSALGGTRRSRRSAGRGLPTTGRPRGASAAPPPPSGSGSRTGPAGASAR